MARHFVHRADENQAVIVDGLRRIGAFVSITSQAGAGFPDLVVNYRSRWHLIEVIGDQKASRYRNTDGLTPAQTRWHERCPVEIPKVRTLTEALHAIGASGG